MKLTKPVKFNVQKSLKKRKRAAGHDARQRDTLLKGDDYSL